MTVSAYETNVSSSRRGCGLAGMGSYAGRPIIRLLRVLGGAECSNPATRADGWAAAVTGKCENCSKVVTETYRRIRSIAATYLLLSFVWQHILMRSGGF